MDEGLANKIFSYSPETGELRWRVKRGPYKAGRPAGTINKATGYLHVKIFGRNYKVHRIAWLIAYGQWPCGHIDHINGDPADNRLTNLRVADSSQNAMNRRLRCDNRASRETGVYFRSRIDKWEARITARGQTHYLGVFGSKEEALEARRRAEAVHHGEFSRTLSREPLAAPHDREDRQ